jgi:hypothetical protein
LPINAKTLLEKLQKELRLPDAKGIRLRMLDPIQREELMAQLAKLELIEEQLARYNRT